MTEAPSLPAFNQPARLGFPTTLGPWGPLLAGFYDVARTELPHERGFWKSLISPDMDVLEIGAGNGFISTALAEARPRTLTLVEPEKENIRILEHNLAKEKFRMTPEIVPARFETGAFRPQDLIVLPFDTLPMITDTASRAKIFLIAAKYLKPGGTFVLHVSTDAWVERFFATPQNTVTQACSTYDKRNLLTKRTSRRISESQYIKFYHLKDESTGLQENYLALTSIVTPEEILSAAKTAGLTLSSWYSDFEKHPGPVPTSDDHIFVFKKVSSP